MAIRACTSLLQWGNNSKRHLFPWLLFRGSPTKSIDYQFFTYLLWNNASLRELNICSHESHYTSKLAAYILPYNETRSWCLSLKRLLVCTTAEPCLILHNKVCVQSSFSISYWNRRLSPNLLTCRRLSQGRQSHKPLLNNDSKLSHPVTVDFWHTINKDIRYCTQRNRLTLICMQTSITAVFTTMKRMMQLYMYRPVHFHGYTQQHIKGYF